MLEKLDFLNSCKHIFSNITCDLQFKILGVLLVWVTWIFGTNIEILAVISLLIAMDTITGALKGLSIPHNFSSRKFFRFAAKILVYFIMIALGRVIDRYLAPLHAPAIVEGFLVMTEVISVLENIAQLGFPIPKSLKAKLEVFKKD